MTLNIENNQNQNNNSMIDNATINSSKQINFPNFISSISSSSTDIHTKKIGKRKVHPVEDKQSIEKTAENQKIDDYETSNDTDPMSFAENCASKVKNQKDESDITFKKAMEDALKDGEMTAKNIQNYAGLNQRQLFEIAKVISMQKDSPISKYIGNFNLQEYSNRFEIAKSVVMSLDSLFSFGRNFRNYNLLETDLLDLVINFAQEKDPGKIIPYMRHFQFINQEKLLELSKILVAKEASYTMQCIKSCIGLKNPSFLFEVAKICIVHIPGILNWGLFTNNFEEITKNQIFELAKISAASDPEGHMSKQIHDHGFTEDQRFEIAKIAANHSEIAPYIERYRFQNDGYLQEILAIVLKRKENLAPYIRQFRIENPLERFKIAQEIAEREDLAHLAPYIKNFDLENSNQRYEIAKLIAGKKEIADYIQDFRLEDSGHRYEIAMLAIEKEDISGRIFDFDIKDQSHLYDVALRLISKGHKISRNMRMFKIEDVNKRYELAKLDFKNIKKIKFREFSSTGLEFVTYYQLNLEQYIELFTKFSMGLYYDKCIDQLNTLISNFEFEKVKEEQLTTFRAMKLLLNPSSPFNLKEIPSLIPLLKFERKPLSDMALLNVRKWIGYFLLQYEFFTGREKELFENFYQEMDGPSFFSAVTEMRNPMKRYQLTTLFFHHYQENRNAFLKVYQNLKNEFGNKTSPIFKFLLSHLIFLQTKDQIDVDWDHTRSDWNPILRILDSSPYKDANAQKIVINSLYTLINADLKIEGKCRLLHLIFGLGNNIKEKKARAKLINLNLRLMEAIIQSENCNLLKPYLVLGPNSLLLKKDSLQECIQNIVNANIGKIEIKDFAEKFENTFMKSRQPIAFFTYASQLKSENMQDYLKTFYINILEGSLHQFRYEHGEHLSKIFEWKSGLKEKWKQGKIKLLSEMSSEVDEKSKHEKQFDIKQYLHQRICQDNHIDSKKFSVLRELLIGTQNLTIKQVDSSLQQISATKKKLEVNGGIGFEKELQYLQFEKSLIDLCNPRNSLNENEEFIKASIELGEKIYLQKDHQFLRDLRDLNQLMKPKARPQSVDDWRVEDTDTWDDLLLCGTEVSGSCQNINGFSGLNKCLLNYILDGKNRIVVLKNPEGQIQARVVLRILWDEENKQPVLFQERLYSSPGVFDAGIKAIDNMCIEKARFLQIPLVKSREEQNQRGNAYQYLLKSFNSFTPFEYVDAEGLGEVDGSFTLSRGIGNIVYNPSL